MRECEPSSAMTSVVPERSEPIMIIGRSVREIGIVKLLYEYTLKKARMRLHAAHGFDENECTHKNADHGHNFFEQRCGNGVRQPHTAEDPEQFQTSDPEGRAKINEAMPHIAQRTGTGSGDLNDLTGGDGRERMKA